jgi:hypothetical protein
MGEFRLPSGLWGTDIYPDWAIKNTLDSYIIRPVGSNPLTKDLEPLIAIHHTGNISFQYSSGINGELHVNGSSGYCSYIYQNVGIQLNNPDYELDINGNINCMYFHGNGALITDIQGGCGSKWKQTENGSIYYNEGNISINTNDSISLILLNVNGCIYGDYDKDTTSYFGYAAIGATATSQDIATFSHINHNTDTNFALAQDANGNTIINSNGLITLSVNNTDIILIDNNITINNNVQINGRLSVINKTDEILNENIYTSLLILNNNTTEVYDSGFISERGDDINVGIIWDDSETEFALINTTIVNIQGNVPINSYVGIKMGEIHINGTADSYILGVVGVNTTDPQYELDINGSITAMKYLVNGVSLVSGEINIEYIHVSDTKTVGTNGGTLTENIWNIRDLNTISYSYLTTNVLLSSNQLTIQPGNYIFYAKVPAYHVNRHIARLYNITDSLTEEYGTTMEAYKDATTNSDNSYSSSIIDAYISITSPKTYEIQHYVFSSQLGNGGGLATGFSVDEIYTIVTIECINE